LGNEDKTKIYTIITKGLKRQPAYLLVFGIVFIICTGAAIYLYKYPLPASLLIFFTIVLAGFAIYLVENRTAVRTTSAEEQRDVSTFREERTPIKDVFEGLVDNDSVTYFVYSNTPVKEFYDHDGNPIDYPFDERELRVTSIPDVRGLAKIHTLLHLGGKTDRQEVITAQEFTPQHWKDNLIFIGSRNSNPKTEDALQNFNSPFRFSEDMKSILELDSTEGPWPKPDEENMDYGIVVKLKIVANDGEERIYLILAGVGPIGTLACCHFFQKNIVNIHKNFRTAPFAYFLSVNRELGYTSVKEEKSKEITSYRKK
jgi:hypothetical protein